MKASDRADGGGDDPPDAPLINQEFRTKIRALKRLRFFGAEVWCRINS